MEKEFTFSDTMKFHITRKYKEISPERILDIDSLDQMVDNERDFSLIDTIASDFDTFEEVMKRQNKEQFIDKVQEYMSGLSNQQINILNLLIDGYTGREIQKVLDISDREYTSNLTSMRSYEKVKALF